MLIEDVPLSLRAENFSSRKAEDPLTNSVSFRTACVFFIYIYLHFLTSKR